MCGPVSYTHLLHGNIGTDSAIVKFSAVDPAAWKFSGPAKCYDSQDDAWHAILRDEIVAGDVVVIRYEGPKGSPGMPHMETFMAAVLGKGLGSRIDVYKRQSRALGSGYSGEWPGQKQSLLCHPGGAQDSVLHCHEDLSLIHI